MLRSIAARKNHSLTAQGTDLGSSYIETVAMGCEERKGNIIDSCAQAIAKTGSVYVQKQIVLRIPPYL